MPMCSCLILSLGLYLLNFKEKCKVMMKWESQHEIQHRTRCDFKDISNICSYLKSPCDMCDIWFQ
jgi:hypothetical protein